MLFILCALAVVLSDEGAKEQQPRKGEPPFSGEPEGDGNKRDSEPSQSM